MIVQEKILKIEGISGYIKAEVELREYPLGIPDEWNTLFGGRSFLLSDGDGELIGIQLDGSYRITGSTLYSETLIGKEVFVV